MCCRDCEHSNSVFRWRRRETLPRSFKLLLLGDRRSPGILTQRCEAPHFFQIKMQKNAGRRLTSANSLLPGRKNHFTLEAPCLLYLYPSWGVRRRRGKKSNKDGEDVVASVLTRRRIIPNVIFMTGWRKSLAETSGEDI